MAAADQSYDLKKEFGIVAENYPKFHEHFDGAQQKALIDEDIFAAKSVMAVFVRHRHWGARVWNRHRAGAAPVVASAILQDIRMAKTSFSTGTKPRPLVAGS